MQPTVAAANDDARASSSPSWFVPALAIAVALATGMLEIPLALLRRDLFLVALNGDVHVLWMAALANLVLVLPIATLLWSLNRIWPGPRTERVAALVLLTLAAFALLSYIPRVTSWGLVIIAIGIGVRASGRVMQRRPAFHRGVSRLALVLPFLILLYAGVAFAWTPLRERWLNRGLPPASGRAPNVLLLVLDTVRAMRLSLYGYNRATTPALDRWARSGTVFDQAIATASWTTPSHAGMFTGRYPHELNAGFRTPLDNRWPTLAEVLAKQGYRTAGFSANRKYASYETGLARGFSRFQDYRVSPGQIMISSSLGSLLLRQRWFQHLIGYYDLYGRKNAARVSDEFLSWVGQGTAGRPFFAFLNYFDAHDPYLAPAPFDRRFTSDTAPFRPLVIGPSLTSAQRDRELQAHDGAIAYLDHEIDRLLRTLEARGVLENTLVILTADHGEQFGEHQLMDHGNSLYRSLLDVPLFLRLPGRVPPGTRISTPVTLRDLPATVLDLTGIRNQKTFPGFSWASYWRPGESDLPRSPLLSELTWPDGEIAYTLRVNDYEYIDWFQQKEELYDLRTDPAESRNLARKTDHDITSAYRALRDSVVGNIHRPSEVGRLQALLTGIHR
jgi:arylsulfatase A-like enzyme